MMKRTIPTAGLVVLPNAGHTINLEKPAAFNQQVADFLHATALGRWPVRDPRAMANAGQRSLINSPLLSGLMILPCLCGRHLGRRALVRGSIEKRKLLRTDAGNFIG
jgi:hypothetical protein